MPIENLRLGPHKGVKSVRLEHLGHINVLCGPNGSGKTSIVECLLNERHIEVGIECTRGLAKVIADKFIEGRTWNHASYAEYLTASTVEAFGPRTHVYKSTADEVYREAEAGFRRRSRGQLDQGVFQAAYLAQFPDLPTMALMPAKRLIDSQRDLGAVEHYSHDGNGLLAYLFEGKNRPDADPRRREFTEISNAFREISAGSEFDLYLSGNQISLQFRTQGGPFRKAGECGLGLRELLSYASSAVVGSPALVAFEEPETHLHPDIQRRLMTFLRTRSDRQFIITTHSSVISEPQLSDSVYLCRCDSEVRVENATSRATVLAGLGYSVADNLVSDAVLLCEGPYDRRVFAELLSMFGIAPRHIVKTWALGGDIMSDADLSVLSAAYRVFAVVDGDPGSARVRTKFVRLCEASGVDVCRLDRYSIENYFSLAAIREEYSDKVIDSTIELDAARPVAEILGFEVKRRGAEIVRRMSLSELQATDLGEFLVRMKQTLGERR